MSNPKPKARSFLQFSGESIRVAFCRPLVSAVYCTRFDTFMIWSHAFPSDLFDEISLRKILCFWPAGAMCTSQQPAASSLASFPRAQSASSMPGSLLQDVGLHQSPATNCRRSLSRRHMRSWCLLVGFEEFLNLVSGRSRRRWSCRGSTLS